MLLDLWLVAWWLGACSRLTWSSAGTPSQAGQAGLRLNKHLNRQRCLSASILFAGSVLLDTRHVADEGVRGDVRSVGGGDAQTLGWAAQRIRSAAHGVGRCWDWLSVSAPIRPSVRP